jgi:DNA-directed RNA polymerase specialized sigma subunit
MTNNEISELVLKVQKFNDLDSYNQLLKKFDNLINSTAYYVIKKVPRVSVSKEDLVNILSYAFYELTKEYDPEKGMHYATYMKVNLNYKAHNYVRSLISKSHQVMNNSVTFNDEAYEQTEEEDSGVLEDIRTNYKNYN